MIRYINCKTSNGVETVDELNSADFETLKLFKAELRRLVAEYRMAFNMPVWSSQRCDKTWNA